MPAGSRSAVGQLEYIARNVDRVLDILEVLATEPARASEIGMRLGLPKASGFRLLLNLEERGYVRRDPETQRYSLTYKLLQLGAAVLDRDYQLNIIRPMLSALARKAGETAQFWVLEGEEVVCVEQYESPHDLRMMSRIGRRLPLNCAAIGWAVLAHQPEDVKESCLAKPIPQFTPHSISRSEVIRYQLERVLSEGYAFSRDGVVLGAAGMAAPVWNARNEVRGAIHLLGPTHRMTESATFERIRDALLETSARVSAGLGYTPPNNGNQHAPLSSIGRQPPDRDSSEYAGQAPETR